MVKIEYSIKLISGPFQTVLIQLNSNQMQGRRSNSPKKSKPVTPWHMTKFGGTEYRQIEKVALTTIEEGMFDATDNAKLGHWTCEVIKELQQQYRVWRQLTPEYWNHSCTRWNGVHGVVRGVVAPLRPSKQHIGKRSREQRDLQDSDEPSHPVNSDGSFGEKTPKFPKTP